LDFISSASYTSAAGPSCDGCNSSSSSIRRTAGRSLRQDLWSSSGSDDQQQQQQQQQAPVPWPAGRRALHCACTRQQSAAVPQGEPPCPPLQLVPWRPAACVRPLNMHCVL
jgi:hypothetical protein